MTSETRELFRRAILQVLEDHASDKFGFQARAIHAFMAQYGFRSPPADDLHAELIYLHDKLLVAAVSKVISPENTAWRITAAGRDFLAEH